MAMWGAAVRQARVAGVVRALDRRPMLSWIGATCGLSLLAALPGCGLGGPAGYLLGPSPFLWFYALPATLPLLGMLVVWPLLITDLPQRWFGLGTRRSQATAYLALLCGLLPWLVPGGPTVIRAGEADPWSVAYYTAALLVLPAAAALLVPGRRRRQVLGAAACLLTVVAVWLSARQEMLAAETRVSLELLGSPPRPLLRLVAWDGVEAGGAAYRNGRLSVEYDALTPIPAPDGSQVGTLVSEPVPPGDDASIPCLEGVAAEVRVAADSGADADPSTACRPVGPQEWQVGDRTLVLRDGNDLVILVADAEAGAFGDPATLRSVLRTQHVAADAEVRHFSPP